MDRGGAWQAMVHGVTESWTQLKRLSTHAHTHTHIVIIPVCVFLHITIAQLQRHDGVFPIMEWLRIFMYH